MTINSCFSDGRHCLVRITQVRGSHPARGGIHWDRYLPAINELSAKGKFKPDLLFPERKNTKTKGID